MTQPATSQIPPFCPQCGRPLSVEATATNVRCKSCGYALMLSSDSSGADESATRPVAPATAALPATPGMTATQPTDDLDAQTRPAPYASGASPDGIERGGEQAAAVSSRTDKLPAAARDALSDSTGSGGRRPPWGAIVALVVIAALIAAALTAVFVTPSPGGGATFGNVTPSPTLAPTATATLITSLPLTSFSVQGVYSVMYPAAWFTNQQNEKGVNSAIFSARQSSGVNPGVNIIYGAASLFPASMAQRDSDVLQILGSHNPVKNKTGPTTVRLAGQSWTQEAADVIPSGQTQTVHAVALSVTYKGNVYTIVYFADPSEFASLNTAAFQPMLASFTFAS